MLASLSTKLIFVRLGNCDKITIKLYLRITCTKCIDNSIDNNCEICGTEKHKIWHDQDDLDPLEEFTLWALKGFDNKFKTLIYAHYGGVQ